ncbi:DUF433 domain-containing protein [Pseudanabaena sp. FACHB-1277]|uniref:DUF433 domain-containing protein n=1 Tax=Pseudanabaena cinerea FACHB-1277 TaxID=2949581 RepID=A0A926UTV6_9CYAN|nr:DUF433 domain-containing protein [Pseudanabaena cinerea]MBD2149935.1 DUF433 domain-containing protein [Pseudanabaena cinerea FACHB-1277]
MLTASRTVSVPLSTNADGVILVGNTRVTIDTVVGNYKQGLSPEEIVFRYSSLDLSDVYSTIAFYLSYQTEVEEYLKKRQITAQAIREKNQHRFNSQSLRDRLLARQAAK